MLNAKIIIPIATAIIFIMISIAGYNSSQKVGNNDNSWLVKIGNKEYTLLDYQEFYNDLKNNSSLPNNLDLKSYAFDKLVDAALIEKEAEEIGLVISDNIIKEELQKISSFHDENGKFDKKKFKGTLKRNGISENKFIEKMERFYLRKQLMQIFTLNRGVIYPSIIRILNSIIYDQRKAKLITIDELDIQDNIIASQEEINKYFSENEQIFTIPETREIEYVLLTTDSLEDSVKIQDINDDEVVMEYKKQEKYLEIPERRDIEQLICTDKKVVDMAYNAILSGKKFDDVRNKYETPYEYTRSLKKISPNDYFNKILTEILFSLKEGDISRPYQTSLGWHIFYINKIYPTQKREFFEVKDYLINEIVFNKNQEKLKILTEKIDSDIKKKISFEEICNKFKIKSHNVHVQMRYNKDYTINNNEDENKKFDNVPKVIQNLAFNTKLLDISELEVINDKEIKSIRVLSNDISKTKKDDNNSDLQKESIGYVLLKVNKIIPKRLVRPSDKKLEKLLLDQKKYNLLTNLANSIHSTADINDQSDSNIRKDFFNSLKKLVNKPTDINISRIQPMPKNIDLELLGEIFDLEPGKSTKLYFNNERKQYHFAILEDINYPNNNEVINSDYEKQLTEFYFDIINDEYLQYLHKKYKPKLNKSLIYNN
ncbi:SurA N-terminal domain-containing protein [Lyticum sinuosum]|uniref:Parvulin-like PPIase n=1 Tax=Lyticum sinuosum TaxID=1332059 RepID=A0AAE4VK13_9RICK|nr:SurA N-terminal domain-containing protein [Lyticum sinuosum]MDZ5761395.1 Peptidylprolyl isomerase domain protein [Lyticum sinuosum]